MWDLSHTHTLQTINQIGGLHIYLINYVNIIFVFFFFDGINIFLLENFGANYLLESPIIYEEIYITLLTAYEDCK